jgi:diguanylate cyclase (GGDEF)-like protein
MRRESNKTLMSTSGHSGDQPASQLGWQHKELIQDKETDDRRAFLSTDVASRPERRIALAAVLVSAIFFFAAVPFAKIPLLHVPAFVAVYQSVLVICDLITAVLLFAQFNVLRSRALLVLAGGYLFTAFVAVSHMLTYPDLFSPTGLLGAGPQSTAWLYFFWHGGFPLSVIAYALLKDKKPPSIRTRSPDSPTRGRASVAIAASVAAVLALGCGLTLLATAGQDSLPVLMKGSLFFSPLIGIVQGFWMLSFLALGVLWWRRPHTVLDLWLMVVMCGWVFDIGLGAVFNTGRFDLGFYAGRIYALSAASFLLIVLLIENGKHYARLAELSLKLGTANESLERLSLHDSLTDLANRRFFDAYLAGQIAVARRHKRTVALIMCDVDSFKAYNDHYGHQAGDECLKQVAVALRSCCRRPSDMIARYGGEEFALVLPDTDLIGAAQIAEAARMAVARLKILHAHSIAGPYVSISGGVAALLRTIDITAQQLIAAADQTLYQAKHLGRNRMVSVQAEPGYEHV